MDSQAKSACPISLRRALHRSHIDQAGLLLEAAQHQAADATAGFVNGVLDQRKEMRLKRRLLESQKRQMQFGKVVPQIHTFGEPLGQRRVWLPREIHSFDR